MGQPRQPVDQEQWRPVMSMSRSWIDRRTWTPNFFDVDTDLLPHRYAGGLRTLKLWAEEEFARDGTDLRWVHDKQEDSWVLETTAPRVL